VQESTQKTLNDFRDLISQEVKDQSALKQFSLCTLIFGKLSVLKEFMHDASPAVSAMQRLTTF